MKISVTKVMTTETAHRLINYDGKCAHLHGHSYRWEVEAQYEGGGIDDRGIAVDFGDLKAAMREEIHDVFDHATILSNADPLVKSNAMRYSATGHPQKVVLFHGNPTAENFAVYVYNKLSNHPGLSQMNVEVLRVRVWETENSFAEYAGK